LMRFFRGKVKFLDLRAQEIVSAGKIMLKKYIYKMACKYIRRYEGFSYNFHKNGEALLVNRLSSQKIETVFDVGANVGSWSSIALKAFPSATVHAFELSKSTFDNLITSVENEKFVANNIGLSNTNGEINYKDFGENSGVNSILIENKFHKKKVPYELKKGVVRTGNQYCQEKKIDRIDFLKIDVEGAEHLVLEGFSELFSRKSVRVVQFEYGYASGYVHFLMHDFFRLFNDLGYQVGVIKPKGVIFSDFHYRLNDFNSGPNFVAIPAEDIKLRQLLSC